jgi:hypothetical protein
MLIQVWRKRSAVRGHYGYKDERFRNAVIGTSHGNLPRVQELRVLISPYSDCSSFQVLRRSPQPPAVEHLLELGQDPWR